jgi:hypothetical protein
VHRILLAGLLGVLTALAIGYGVARVIFWSDGSAPGTVAVVAGSAEAPDTRKIRASLYYVSEDGLRLVPVEREVPFGEGTLAQARHLIEAQLQPAPAPFKHALPEQTTLRTLFLSDNGNAYVDLSREVSALHTGGSLDELFAVYTVVNVLTVNLPAIAGVQILVDGQEVDTLAGHVDIRAPLPKSLRWVAPPPGVPAS